MRILIDGQTLSTPDIKRGIGEYFLNVISNIVNAKNTDVKIYLAVYDDFDRSSITHLMKSLKMVTIGKKLVKDDRSSRVYTQGVIEAIKKYDIDIFWIPNPLMANVNFIDGSLPCKVITTIYDLIPLKMKKDYLDKWPAGISDEYKRRISVMDQFIDEYLSISDTTKKDMIEELTINSAKIHTVYLGSKINSDKAIENPVMELKYGSCRFILYPGGFDPRKNMQNAVLAFKKITENKQHGQLRLIITCSCDEITKNNFIKFLSNKHLDKSVTLTGYIPEPELLWLYDHASVLFFPSLYEGFGLPIVEAMSRGVPVVASKRSSIPEVLGDAGILVDPENIEEMAEALDKVLSDDKLRQQLGNKSKERSVYFSWEKTASKTLEVFTGIMNSYDLDTSCNGRLVKIAYFSPMPPQKSGIAVYSKELLRYLKKYAIIDIFLDDGVDPEPEIKRSYKCYSYREYERLVEKEKYDVTIYNMGNNTIHKYIYKILLKYPGITVLHDYVIHPFIQHITVFNGNPSSYVAEMKYAYGVEGEKLARDCIKNQCYSIDCLEYPLNERIFDSSKCVIVHSYYAKYLASRGDIRVIPHGRDTVDLDENAIAEHKNAFGLRDAWPIIGCYGYMNFNKRLDVLIDVFKDIAERYPNARLLLAGDIEKEYKKGILNLVNKCGLTSKVVITGYIDEETYKRYVACADIIINLRYPTMGETSGTLLDAMAYGKPVIVSNIGSYKEYPDHCCWKVDLDSNERELIKAYLIELIDNGRLRETMGNNAKKYTYKHHRWEKVALEYIKIINLKK